MFAGLCAAGLSCREMSGFSMIASPILCPWRVQVARVVVGDSVSCTQQVVPPLLLGRSGFCMLAWGGCIQAVFPLTNLGV